MTVVSAWPATRFVHRTSWWVFVVVAMAAQEVTWLPSNARTVTYHGSYEPLNGVDSSKAYETALDISFGVLGRSEWVGPVTLIAACLTVVAAVVEAVLARRGLGRAVVMILGSVVAVVIAGYALNGISDSRHGLALHVLGVLIAVAVHEGAMALCSRWHRATHNTSGP